MKQNPWKSPSLHLLEGKSKLVRQAQEYATIDAALRCLLALPEGKGESTKSTLRRRLSAAQLSMSVALDAIWHEGTDVLRKSIADSRGPVDPLASASGLAAYVDLAEHTLGAFAVILDEGSPGPPAAHFLERTVRLPSPWIPAHYAKATAWIQANLTQVGLHDMGICAVQDLVRQRGLVKLTALDMKRQAQRRAARDACFDSDGKLLVDAGAVLNALAKGTSPLMQKQLVDAKKVPFGLRKLKAVMHHLQVLDLVRKTPLRGFDITRFGLSRLRFTASRG